MKSAYAKNAAYAAAVMLLAVSITGCQIGGSHPSDSGSASGGIDGQPSSDAGVHSDSPQKTYDTKDNGSVVPAVDNGLSGDAAATISDASTASTSGKAGKTPPATAKNEDIWNAKAPKLLGIAIAEARTAVLAKLGKPSDSYALDDDDEKLTVEEYSAFSIGYTSDKKVKFVDVFDKAAEPGLGGLRVGDAGNEALKTLGKPATHTSSVLAYEANGALLKLDLDPQNSRVLSIKLFSAKE